MHQVVERTQGLSDRRRLVGPVELVEIDTVGLEATKARLTLKPDVATTATTVVRSFAHLAMHLGGEDDVVATCIQCPAHHRLRAAAVVDVGSVDEIDPAIERGGDCGDGLVVISEVAPEVHGSQTKRTYA